MYLSSQKFISFKAISLNKEETKRTDDLLILMDNPIQKEQAKHELFDIYSKHLQKEAKSKARGIYYQEDFLQRLYLTFLESIENVKFLTAEKLLAQLNKTKPNKEEIKEGHRFGIDSLEKELNGFDKRTIESTLSNKNILKPLSIASPEERTKKLKIINKLTDTLSEKEQFIISQRASGKKLKDIAQQLDISSANLELKTQSAIAKIQLNNNVLPSEYEQFADEFIKIMNLKTNKNHVIDFLINNIELVNYGAKTLDANIEKTSKLLGIDKKIFIPAALKQPQLFYQKPETIFNNIKTTSEMLEIDKKTFIPAALKQPQLFYQKPETIFNNIKTTSEMLEIDKKTFIPAALKQPQLFYQKPETIFNNIKTTSELLGVDKKVFIPAALKQTPLFVRKPESIFENVEKISKLLNIDKKLFISIAIKQPHLFSYDPKTIIKKVDIIKYYKQIQGKNKDKIIISTNSDKQLYYDILAYLIKQNDKLHKTLKSNEIINYVKAQDKIYNFIIPNHELAEEFISYIQDFSKTNFGKQVFKIVVNR